MSIKFFQRRSRLIVAGLIGSLLVTSGLRGDWPQWGEGSQRPPKTQLAPLRVPIIGDGVYRTYEVDLSKLENYRGAMVRLKILLPAATGKAKVRSVRFAKP